MLLMVLVRPYKRNYNNINTSAKMSSKYNLRGSKVLTVGGKISQIIMLDYSSHIRLHCESWIVQHL